jgi:Ca2+-binding RTX toxin-like protein/PKD repeat protein/flagellar hook assembly protein FlgD
MRESMLPTRARSGVVAVLGIFLAGMAIFGLARAAESLDITVLTAERAFSPDGDGQDDAVSVTYCLSEAANMDIWVTSGSGARVRSVEDGVSHAGGSCSAVQSQFSWDGKDDDGRVVADGVYTAHLQGHSADAQSGDMTIRLGVDTRAPGALSTPAPGSTLSGTVAWVFTPTAGFELDSVSVGCQGGGWSTSPEPGPGGRYAGELDTSGCANGANQLQPSASWTDQFAQSHSWSAPGVAVTLRNPPQLTVQTAARSFSPDGDDQEDTASGGYCLTQPAQVDIWVASASGTRVRTIEDGKDHDAEGCGWSPTWFSWDGRDGGGQVVPDGVYTVHLLARNAGGDSGGATLQLGVDTRSPGRLTTPSADAVVSGTTAWAFTPTAGFDLGGVSVSCQGGGGGWASSDTPGPDGRFTGELDTSGCGNGPNQLQAAATWTDQFGQAHSWSAPAVAVTVRSAPQVSVLSGERYFSPDGDEQEDAVSVSYCLSQAATVDIWVTDSSGARVRAIEDRTAHDSAGCGWGQNVFSWDGKDDRGRVVPDGLYAAHLTAANAAGDSGDVSIRVGVDTRRPGALTTPPPGAELTGPVPWELAPAADFRLETASVSCQGGPAGSAGTAGDDGTFTGTLDTSTCTDGDNRLTALVSWTDPLGGWHSWSAPPLPVTVRAAPQVSITSPERYFHPGGGQEDTVDVSFCLSQPATVDVWVTDGSGARVRTVESGVERAWASCSWWFTWDGKDDDGRVVADGVYVAHLRARTAGGSASEASIRLGIDTRAAGAIISPAANDTLAGLARFTYQPATGLATERVDLAFDTGGQFAIHNASPDGLWRTSRYTGTLQNGPATLRAWVSYRDPFGFGHNTPVAEVPVVIDDTALPLTVAAGPAAGPAPLVTTFQITTSDPAARGVHYTVQFGDGTPATEGDIAAPYPVAGVAHTYRDPGAYRAVVTVTNSAGASSTKAVDISAAGAGNTAPAATLNLDATSGTAPLPIEASVAGSDADGDPLTYRVDFGDDSPPVRGSLPHAPVGHTYDRAGTYLVRLAVSDGRLTSVKTATVVVGLAEELAANAGDDQAVAVNDTVRLDGSGSRPSAGIESYSWDLGDGATADGATVDHAYAAEGTYTATLTVTAGGRSERDTAVVTVSQRQAQNGLVVTARDEAGAAVADAQLVVVAGSGTRHSATTEADGTGTLQGLADGAYTVYGWRPGYLPAKTPATVTGGAGQAAITLKAGQVATTSLTSTPMTQDQVVAAGIDPTDPDNQHVYEFKIYLNFEGSGTPTVVTGYTATGGFPLRPSVSGGGEVIWDGAGASFGVGGGGYHVSMSVSYIHDRPQLLWLVIPGKATWLKEFFSVQMMVTNLADPDFTLENGSATLTVPAGLSLAPTAVAQSPTATLEPIPGGQSRTATWVLRGDTEGRYDLSASYAGTLEPFGDTVTMQAATDRQLHVWGGSALELVVDTDDTATTGHPYHVSVGLKNVADVPVYNPTIELLKEGKKNYIYQPREQLVVTTAELAPGQTLSRDYILVPTITGTLNLERSFVSKTAGDVELPAKITSHPPVNPPDQAPEIEAFGMKGKVGLTWDPVPGATGYQVYSTPDPETDFPAQPAAGSEILPAEGVRQRAVIRGVPEGTTAWYAISPLVGGQPSMRHPLVQARSTTEAPSPTVQADYSWPSDSVHTCGVEQGRITFTFTERFFGLSEYKITAGEATRSETDLSGRTRSDVIDIDLRNGPVTVTAQARNDDGDWGPPWTRTFDAGCGRDTAVVVAMGLNSSLSADGRNEVDLDCEPRSDTDEFNKMAATNACDAPREEAGDNRDPRGNLISYLHSKGYVDGDGRQSPNRTLLEFSYNGASASCADGGPPTFKPVSYDIWDTRRHLVEELAVYGRQAAARYVDALRDYSRCWKERHGRELTFHVVGHSEGGYEALAMAYEAATKAAVSPGQGYEGLIASIVTVDGAINPHVVVPELRVGTCFAANEALELPVDVAQKLLVTYGRKLLPPPAQAAISAAELAAHPADWLWSGHLIDVSQEAETKVAMITNQHDGCLSPNATLHSGADYSETFRVRYKTSGVDGHNALLTSHGAPTHEPGYPLIGVLAGDYLPAATVLPPRVDPSSAGAARLAAAAETGRLVGRLVHPVNGGPLPAGQVVAHGRTASTYTDVQQDGTFAFDALPVGDYRLFVHSFRGAAAGAWVGGPTMEDARAFGVQAGTTDAGDVAGAALEQLTVRLTGTDGQPIRDGFAVLVDESGGQAASGRADATGAVTLNAPAGSYSLGAASPTTEVRSTEVDLTGTASVELELEPAAVVAATVKDENGAPLPSVAVALYSGSEVVAVGFTGVDGTHQFTGLDPGDYTVKLYEALDRFELPEVVLPATAVVGDPAAGQVSYTEGQTPASCTIVGTAGHDRIRGTSGDDVICGLGGNDVIDGRGGADRLVGAEGNDRLAGGAGNDTLDGGAGDDRVSGDDGDDTLQGGDGVDRLAGGRGNDKLDAGAQDDQLLGGAGDDELLGGAGNDSVSSETGNDHLGGGDGLDRLSGGRGNDQLDGGDGDDMAYGESGDDRLTGGAGNDRLNGGAGNDSVHGEAGDDQLDGGGGDDLLDGGAGTDRLAGGSGKDQLLGGADADALSGGSGDDQLDGGDGIDSCKGNGGRNQVVGCEP